MVKHNSPKSCARVPFTGWIFGLSEPLTFLVLQPQLLLDLLAGEVDAAAQLGPIERLRHVVAAVLLEEDQQFLARALRRQRLQYLGEA